MVFKIFLNRATSLAVAECQTPKRLKPNKRIMDRFNVSHHRLQLRGSKGGYIVQDLSDGGFSATAVDADREAIAIGDAFAATLSFRNRSVTVHAKAAWRDDQTVGLQFVDTEEQVEQFLQTILTPVKMGATLKRLDASFMEQNTDVLWFHGDFDSNITLELAADGGVSAWSFYDPECLVMWREADGLSTGVRQRAMPAGPTLAGNWLSATQLPQDAVMDAQPDAGKVQFVYDVLQLFESEHRPHLMATIEEARLGI